jgi:hypothetical protein
LLGETKVITIKLETKQKLNNMKKLSVFIALCIILSSCTKTVDVFAKIIKEDVSVPGKKYKVPVEINVSSEEEYVMIKKEIHTVDGEFTSDKTWLYSKGGRY